MILKQIFLFSFLVLSILSSIAQETIAPGDKTEKIVYKFESGVGLNINSNGWGINYRRGKHHNGDSRRMFDFDVVKFRHSKELKVINSEIENSRSFIYGKLNATTIVRTGVGTQNILFSKDGKSSIEIRYSIFFGPSWGLAKPYYLKVINDRSNPYPTYEWYDPNVHNVYNIQGRANYSYGLNKMKIHPGLYGKFGFSFEYGTEDEFTKIIETGCILDFYPKPMQVMAFNNPNPLVFTLYVSLIMGRKWY